jgi:hypothetical protein
MAFAQLETLLDQAYLRQPIPHPNRVLAIWYCLTASEDAQRCMFTELGARLEMSRIIFYVDKFKYSMRYALDRIAKETKDKAPAQVPRGVLEKYFKVATQLMVAGIDHSLASQLCAALHSGSASAFESDDGWHVEIDEAHHDKAYGALEMIGAAKRTTVDFATLLFHWIRNSSEIPEVVKRIADSVTRRGDSLSYTYDGGLAVELVRNVPQQPQLLPAQWRFSWGTALDTTLLTNALALRCIYHIAAIHFGAGVRDLRGGGVSNIVLVILRDQLIEDLRLMTSLAKSKVRAFCKFLTWGFGTATPDPALQPLIPITPGGLAIPCLHLLSSDQQRNLLSLLARTDSASFNSQSHLFEYDMVAVLRACAAPSGVLHQTNLKVVIDREEEEIDAVFISEREQRILICELRWMLGPGDPREVQNRKKACLEKVTQLRRKVKLVSKRPDVLAATAFGLAPAVIDWVVDGVVLIAGYAGTRSPDPRFAIMPVRLFESGLNQADSLSDLTEWCQGLSWLPKEGRHFEVTQQEINLDGAKSLKIPGFDIPDSAANFSADALETLSKRPMATTS